VRAISGHAQNLVPSWAWHCLVFVQWQQVFGQKKVVGSIVGGRADMNAMLQLAAIQGIAPLIETLPLSKV